MTELFEWEIFVPSTGIPYARHLEWDREILSITKGLSLLGKVTGKWLDPNEQEESIRVSLVCSEAEIKHIARFTKSHFKQDAILVIKRAEAFLI